MPIQSAFGPLRRVLVRPPNVQDLAEWREHGWRSAPDPDAAADEHARFRQALADSGAEVILAGEPVPGDPDAIYVYDPVLVIDAARSCSVRVSRSAAPSPRPAGTTSRHRVWP